MTPTTLEKIGLDHLDVERTRRWLRRRINALAEVIMLASGPVERKFYRADGGCVCSICGDEYRNHARDPFDNTEHVLCDGSLVHL